MIVGRREHRPPVRPDILNNLFGERHVLIGVGRPGFGKDGRFRDALGEQVSPDRFGLGHRFVPALAAGWDEHGFLTRAFLLLTPEGDRPVRPAAQQRGQGTVLPEPAAYNDDKIPVQRRLMPGRLDPADHGAGQHALKVGKDGGVGVVQRIPDAYLHFRPGNVTGKQHPANRVPRDQQKADQDAEKVAQPDPLVSEQGDIADHHGGGEGKNRRGREDHKMNARAVDGRIAVEHGKVFRMKDVPHRHHQRDQPGDQGKNGEAGVKDRGIGIKRRALHLEKMPGHHRAD